MQRLFRREGERDDCPVLSLSLSLCLCVFLQMESLWVSPENEAKFTRDSLPKRQ